MELTEEEWKRRLTPQQYAVLRQKGTEVPFTGMLLNNKQTGSYNCVACGAELFRSDHKFDSGSGWPSFYDVARHGAVRLAEDDSLGMHRTEVICANCGSHLGHLFDDAYDQPGGKRYCINSVCLDFKQSDNQSS